MNIIDGNDLASTGININRGSAQVTNCSILGNYARAINNQGKADSVHVEHIRSLWQVLLSPTNNGTPNYQSISQEKTQLP